MHINKITINQNRFPTKELYPFNLPLFQNTKAIDLTMPATVFIGENGAGKSTLLKAMCSKCKIHIWEGVPRVRYELNPFENKLPGAIDIHWVNGYVPGSFFSPELFRNFSQLLDEWAVSTPDILEYFGGESLMTKSHGQSTMAYFRSIYQKKGLYFLDEPEAALSPKTQLDLLGLLNDITAKGDAQFIISTHSPILMSCRHAEIYSFDDQEIERIDYADTPHYRVYKEFFNRV